MSNPAWLPQLILLKEHDSNWSRYLKAVYEVFLQDMVYNVPVFNGQPVRVGSQLIDGKERTFWHLVSEGDVESNRTPDMRRCERIAWVRAVIDNEDDQAVLNWPNERHRKRRHLLWLRRADFLVILEKRFGCWRLWTAYPTDRVHTQKKLVQEYEVWKKANAAP